jgi:predicted amidohydrolase YtcJ
VKEDSVMSADLALTSGKVLTMNQSQPYAEAIAIKDDRIVQVDANEEGIKKSLELLLAA